MNIKRVKRLVYDVLDVRKEKRSHEHTRNHTPTVIYAYGKQS